MALRWPRALLPLLLSERISPPADGQTSVPPILGWENENITSATKSATPYHSASSRSLLSGRSDVFEGSTSKMQKNLELGSSRCDIVKHNAACAENDSLSTASGSFRVHPKSSKVARKILEHLDRTVSSPQNKPFKLKFPIEKKTLPPAGMTKILNGQDNKPCPGFPNTSLLCRDDVIRSAEVQKANEGVSLSFRSVTVSDSPQMQKSLPLRQSFGSECALTTASVSKPEKASFFPDNGFGLSFHASVASNYSREPLVTPTVALHSSDSEGGTNPSFSFGPVVGSGPIFSFGNIFNSSSTGVADTSLPLYGFGSDDSSRISFRSFSKDAICY